MERLLPLNSIRVFAAVGRLLSVSRAADELHVTASAISHQIKSLEDHLGVKLLRRNGNHISLTHEGVDYLQQISEGLLTLSRATSTLRKGRARRTLNISAPPSLSTLWLIPRLARFVEAHPDLPLAVTGTRALADFDAGQCDIAIRYCQQVPPGLRGYKLCSNEVFPICSPKLMSGSRRLRELADLQQHTLIDCADDEYQDSPLTGWPGWLQAAKVSELIDAKHLLFHPRYVMYTAVLAGLGIGLGKTLPVADHLARGELVCPFGPLVPLTACYYLIIPESTPNQPGVAIFCDWLLAEVRASLDQLYQGPLARHRKR